MSNSNDTTIARPATDASPQFCPQCGERGGLSETSGALHAEGGCYLRGGYCHDGPLSGYACKCGFVFLVEPSEDEIHDGCECAIDSGCECGRYKATEGAQ